MSVKAFMTRLLAICAIWILAASAVQAQLCDAVVSDVDFGTIDVLGTSPTTAVGAVTVSCSTLLGLLSSITVTVNFGNGSGGLSGSLRKMTNPQTSTPLVYQLYKDAARTQPFGGTNGTHGGLPLTLTGGDLLQLLSNSALSIPVYGQVLAGQNNTIPHQSSNYTSVFTNTWTNVQIFVTTCPLLGILLCTTTMHTPSFTVRARVANDCRVAAGDMDFGQEGLLSHNVTATSTIEVKCTTGTPFNIGLGYGIGGTGVEGRYMRSSQGGQVRYQLYKDAARSQPWGLPADGVAFIDTGTGSSRSLTLYGLVPPQPTPRPGAYSDIVTVTVTY